MNERPYAAKPLRRVGPGSIVYVRCIVIGPNDRGPFVAKVNEPVAEVAVADRMGRPADGCRYYLPESQLITMADAYRAVREKAT